MSVEATLNGEHRIYEGRVVRPETDLVETEWGDMIRCQCLSSKGEILVPAEKRAKLRVPPKVPLAAVVKVLQNTPMQTATYGSWKRTRERLMQLSQSADLLEIASCVGKLNNPAGETLGKTEGAAILRNAHDRLVLWLAVAHRKQPSEIVKILESRSGTKLPVTYVSTMRL